MTTDWPWQPSQYVIPTEDTKGPSGGTYGGRNQRAPTQLHRSLHSLHSVGMTMRWPPAPSGWAENPKSEIRNRNRAGGPSGDEAGWALYSSNGSMGWVSASVTASLSVVGGSFTARQRVDSFWDRGEAIDFDALGRALKDPPTNQEIVRVGYIPPLHSLDL